MEQTMAAIGQLMANLSDLFLVLLFVGGAVRMVELIQTAAKMRKHVRSLRAVDYRRFQDSEHIMPVSLILPAAAKNESITDAVKNLLSQEFKQFELIVVVDRGEKESWDRLEQDYHLLPFHQPYKKTLNSSEIRGVYRSADDVRLIVLDLKAVSCADALNAGINVSSYPIIAVSSPELRLTKDALLKTIYAFTGDPNCVFIGAYPRIGFGAAEDGTKRLTALGEMQGIERLRMLYSHRFGYETLGMYLPLQTMFAAILKSTAQEAGGFSDTANAELADLLLRIHAKRKKEKREYKVRLMPEAICYQIPQRSMRVVCAQARRAESAMRVVCRRNRAQSKAIRGITYTRLAETGWPLAEWVGILVIAVSAVLGAISPLYVAGYLALSFLLGAIQSVASVLLEESAFQRQTDTGLLLERYWLAVWENIVYRPQVTLAKLFTIGR
ncbi:hypothetical protein SDC9_84569 [bioreactor metagenome]|uniref:Uncharacterized protein n=1 Tax=bioreactor metagenome TaxID=1076179 RepID=A0A644ZB87_9ZZZZ|nr:glycosyltransferase family 2 protein [Christensenella sp.]